MLSTPFILSSAGALRDTVASVASVAVMLGVEDRRQAGVPGIIDPVEPLRVHAVSLVPLELDQTLLDVTIEILKDLVPDRERGKGTDFR